MNPRLMTAVAADLGFRVVEQFPFVQQFQQRLAVEAVRFLGSPRADPFFQVVDRVADVVVPRRLAPAVLGFFE